MTRSIADQTTAELGGDQSILVRQKRDHVALDALLAKVETSTGTQRQEHLNSLCQLVFPHAFAEESVLWPALRRMLPDGAEKQLEDWTIFFLNQTPFNTIAPVLALEKPTANGHKQEGDEERDADQPELLYVLNLVRTKHDKNVRRYVSFPKLKLLYMLVFRVGLTPF